MRILHVSDFHLKSPKGIEVENIFKRLYGIISENAIEKAFNQIVVTGDIRDAKSVISINGALEVINHIAAAADVSDKKQIHFVPGNHDLNRVASDKIAIETIKKRYDYDNGTFDDARSEIPFMLNRFNEFFWKLSDQYYNEDNPWSGRVENPHYLYMCESYALVFVNSSLSCISNSDDGNLILGTAYLKQLIDIAAENSIKKTMFFAHHPLQNLANLEETAFESLLKSYEGITFYWVCGDAHMNRQIPRGYIDLYQVGSLTGNKKSIPDFAIYDVDNTAIERKVFRYLAHLNNPPKKGKSTGGWKCVYIDPKATSIYHDETLI
jgi:predicted phosphodiesterase